jgi:prephenate dehydrogenase (NADP+)
MDSVEIGLIGMGDMGRLYAHHFAQAGWKCNVCDVPSKYDDLKSQYAHHDNISVLTDGVAVSRRSDLIIYSVEAASITDCVKKFGPSTKIGAIVCGQTSVKEPEINAFEKYLPEDVKIISCHSLHGPKVSPKSQPLVVIRHKASDEDMDLFLKVFDSLESKLVPLSYIEHDIITADTQAVTHLAFLR